MNLRPLILTFILSTTTATAAAQSLPAVSSNRPPIPPTPSTGAATSSTDAALRDLTEYLDRLSKLKDDDVEGRLTLARWAADRRMWSQAQEMADQALYRDPGNRAAYAILQQVDDARPLPDEPEAETSLQDEMQRRFGHEFKTRNSKHFIIAYDTTDAYAVQRGVSMEKAYDAFQFYFNMNKLRPDFLEHRLVMILLQNRDDYLAYGRQTEHADLSLVRRILFESDQSLDLLRRRLGAQQCQLRQAGDDLKTQIDSLNASIADAGGQGQAGLVNTLTVAAQPGQREPLQINNRIASNAQIQNNSPHHARGRPPDLLQHGRFRSATWITPSGFPRALACGFEVEDSAGHRGPALVNFGRVPPLKDALKDDQLIPLEQIIITNPDATAENKSLPLFYSESWALFHYLYKFEPRRDGAVHHGVQGPRPIGPSMPTNAKSSSPKPSATTWTTSAKNGPPTSSSSLPRLN